MGERIKKEESTGEGLRGARMKRAIPTRLSIVGCWQSQSFGQFWVMRDGSDGNHGNCGNGESVTYRPPDRRMGSNPTLTAGIKSVAYN